MKTIIMLMPYFGKWPEWINLYIETCKYNPTINWLFFTDCGHPLNKAENVDFIEMELKDFSELVSSQLRTKVRLDDPYKICDLRPAFGDIFSPYIKGFDYFGYGDIDVVYGSLRRFISDSVLQYNIVSFHGHRLSGHCAIFRNCRRNRIIYKRMPGWRCVMSQPACYYQSHNWGFDDELNNFIDRKKNFYREFHTTPDADVEYNNGSFEFPSEWYWKKGVITNSKDDNEYPYFHFMYWKGGVWGRQCWWDDKSRYPRILNFKDFPAPPEWKITEKGFFLLD